VSTGKIIFPQFSKKAQLDEIQSTKIMTGTLASDALFSYDLKMIGFRRSRGDLYTLAFLSFSLQCIYTIMILYDSV